ncbi:hypothetical protein AB1Y20_019729 [Prymnesium parvum]|uniref:BTB domain-containing protein n=1 Tax=Prymnesium parvum TaxID=97485 RepID=A0AB34JRS2_PRYPA
MQEATPSKEGHTQPLSIEHVPDVEAAHLPQTPSEPSGVAVKLPGTPSKYSVPTDLDVKFDDGTVVRSHAVVLAIASPVFGEMLTTETGKLRSELMLPGKLATEFQMFSQALLPAGLRPSSVTEESQYLVLVRWANEFEVDALKTVCEDHLIKDIPVKSGSLKHALQYRLLRRRAQCIRHMVPELKIYIEEIGLLATEQTQEDLAAIWPRICEGANVRLFRMPPVEQVNAMWPFVCASVRLQAVSAVEHIHTGISKVAGDTTLSFFDRFVFW